MKFLIRGLLLVSMMIGMTLLQAEEVPDDL